MGSLHLKTTECNFFINLLAFSKWPTPSRKCIRCYLCISIYLFFPVHFFTWMFSVGTHVRPSGCSLSAQVTLPAAIGLCQRKPTGKQNPPSFSPSLPLLDPLPLVPTPCPSLLTYVPLYLLIYDLISTQRTHSGVWKTLCSHSMEPLSSIKPTQFTLRSLSSVFNLYSNLRAVQRKGDLRFTSHKSPQIFRSFYQQMVWLLFRTTSLHPRTLGIFTLAAQEEILSWRLSHSRSSPINYAVVNPIGTELCQTRTLLIKGPWKGGLRFCFFLHNYYLFGNGGKVNLLHC